MLITSHALRLHVESALAGRVASPFRFQEPQPVTASTGISAMDQLAGGWPRGCLTEVFGGDLVGNHFPAASCFGCAHGEYGGLRAGGCARFV